MLLKLKNKPADDKKGMQNYNYPAFKEFLAGQGLISLITPQHHVKKHHKGEASWPELCHLCSEKFLQKVELSWHLYVVHQIPLPDRYKV